MNDSQSPVADADEAVSRRELLGAMPAHSRTPAAGDLAIGFTTCTVLNGVRCPVGAARSRCAWRWPELATMALWMAPALTALPARAGMCLLPA